MAKMRYNSRHDMRANAQSNHPGRRQRRAARDRINVCRPHSRARLGGI